MVHGFKAVFQDFKGMFTQRVLAQNGRGSRVETASNIVPNTAVFSLPFFGMQSPWVSFDPVEFFHVVSKTTPWFPQNGHVNS